MEIKGYKAFNKDMTNMYGKKFEVGKTYSVDGEIKYGTTGNGYHFASRLEDTLRYVNALTEEVKIAEVTATGTIKESFDEYNGYYEVYSAENIRIDRVLTRKEIIEEYLNMSSDIRLERFLKSFKLNKVEIELFKEKCKHIPHLIKVIKYYQEHDKEVFEREYKSNGIYPKILLKKQVRK